MYRLSAQTSAIFKFSILLSLQFIQADQSLEDQTALQSDLAEPRTPIETLFGDGYICLHVTDPKFATSPAFQTLAKELSEKYNKKTVLHQVESDETDTPHGHKSTVHYEVTTPAPQNLVRPTSRPTPKPKLIPIVCERPGFFSNPNNCSKYYRCVEPVARGKPMKTFHFDCGPGTIFHERIQGCDHPSAVNPKPPCWKTDDGLKGERGQYKTTTTTTTTTPAPEISQSHARPDDSDEQQIPQRPAPLPEDYGQREDLTDGSQELELVEQIPVEQVTYDDLHKKDDFDLTLPKEFTDDGEDQIVQKGDTKAPIPFPEPEEPICTESGSFGHPTNCSRYHQCLPAKGSLILRQHVCAKDLIFDEEEAECRRPAQVHPKPKCWHKHKKTRITETSEKIETIEETKQAPLPHPEEPIDSTETVNHFDEEESSSVTQQVVHPGHHSTKNETKTVTVVTEEIIEETEDKPSPPIQSQIKKKTKKVRKEIPQPTGVKPAVRCTKEGTYGHPTDCNKYFRCERRGGRGSTIKSYQFSCSPVGTVYDESVHQCRLPDQIMPNVPDCAKWDNRYREQFEEEIEVELVDQEEQISEDIDQTHTKGSWVDEDEETTPSPILDYGDLTEVVDNEHEEDDDKYEIVLVDDGKGNKKKIKRLKSSVVTVVNVVTESDESGEIEDSKRRTKKKKGSNSTTTTGHKHEQVLVDTSEEVARPIDHGTKHVETHHKVTVTSEESPSEPSKHGHHHTHTQTSETKTEMTEETEETGYTKEIPSPIDQEPTPISMELVDQETSVDIHAPPPGELTDDGDDIKQSFAPKPDSSEEDTSTVEPWINKTEAWVTEEGLKGIRGQTPTTKKPIPDDVELIEQLPLPHNCDDELELIERLRRERNAAEARANLLETEKTKLEQRLKKMEKDLDNAVKAKVKMTNYVKTMDKTIESYKKEIEQLTLCCPIERDTPEVEELNYAQKKGRKRRSVDQSETSFVEVPVQRYSEDEILTKKMKVKRFRGHGAHLPIHATADSVDQDVLQSLPIDTEIQSGRSRHVLPRKQESSLEQFEAEFNKYDLQFFSHMPVLILVSLICILLTAILLGCFIIRRLNRITTYGISAEELEAYARLKGETDTDKIQTLRHNTQKKALRQGVYFTYVDE